MINIWKFPLFELFKSGSLAGELAGESDNSKKSGETENLFIFVGVTTFSLCISFEFRTILSYW